MKVEAWGVRRLRRAVAICVFAAWGQACETLNTADIDIDRCQRKRCQNVGANCGNIDDACGGLIHCGVCTEPLTCGGSGVDNVCGCMPSTCEAVMGNEKCGTYDDGCGERMDCGCTEAQVCFAGDCCNPQCEGVCGGPDKCGRLCPDICTGLESCGGGAVDNVCACALQCDGLCGGDDGCGSVCADACVEPNTCEGGGDANVCGCTPSSCTDILTTVAADCGDILDGCNDTQTCDAACAGNDVCDTARGKCCTPTCNGSECSGDGCGGVCNPCAADEMCGGGGDAVACSGGAICSAQNWCAEYPLPVGNRLLAISGVAADNIWIVGGRGLVLRWSGAGWAREPSGTTDDLNAVFAMDAGHVWAVGYSGTVIKSEGTGTWVGETNGVEANLRAVWGTASDNMWAVGDGGTILHGVDGTWTTDESHTPKDLHAVWGVDANEVWAVGEDGVILRWTVGLADWALEPSNATAALKAVWGSASSSVHAVGGPGLPNEGVTLLHWDGSGWGSLAVDDPFGGHARLGSQAQAIWGSNGSDIWAAGGHLYHRGTGNWQATRLVEGFRRVNGIWGSATGNVWMVGDRGEVSHWNGTVWSFFYTTPPSLRGVQFFFGSAVDNLWAFGPPGTLLYRGTSGGPWQDLSTPFAQDLADEGVPVNSWSPDDGWALSASDAWIVGHTLADRSPVAVHWNGTNWSVVDTGVTLALYAVWASDTDDVWVGGAQGTLAHWDGQDWLPEASGTTLDLYAIWGAGPTQIWAGGAGTLREYDGFSWTQRGTPHVLDIWGTGSDNVWAVGVGNPIQYNGDNWTVTNVDSSIGDVNDRTLFAVFTSGPAEAWAVGSDRRVPGYFRPLLMRWDNAEAKWVEEESGMDGRLSDVWGPNSSDRWIAGNAGIRRYVP